VCALALVFTGYAGSSLLHRSDQAFAGVEPIGLAIDLSEEKIDVHMDVLGVVYESLTDTLKDEFRQKIEEAIADKGVIKYREDEDTLVDPKPVEVRVDTITSSAPVEGTDDPGRSEFDVRILVPVELTARALQDRLLENGDLLKKIKEQLLTIETLPETNIVVQSAPMRASKRSVAVIDDDHQPLIILDMDIRGIYYNKLSASPEIKAKFVEAVQGGIVAHTTGLDAKSIGLDVSDAGENAGLPFVHVTAKIPVPSGLSADATMSKWPKGSPQIGVEIQQRLTALGGCFEQVTRDAGKVNDIDVFPSALHLGAVRTTYAVHLKVNVDVVKLKHEEGTADPTEAVIQKKVQDALKEMAQVEKNDVSIKLTKDEDDLLKYVAEIRARGEFAPSVKIADWEEKLLPVGRELQKYFETRYPGSIVVDEADDDHYVVMVGIGDVTNEIDTVDLDLVVHGVEYESLSAEKKKAFLTPFVKAVRDGLVEGTKNSDGTPNTWINEQNNENKIHVTVSPRDSDNALNVRIQIPARDKVEDTHKLATDIERNVIVDDKPALQTAVKANIEKMPGIEFLSTWTPHAIHVSVPGKVGINDFAGDISGHMDKISDQFDKA